MSDEALPRYDVTDIHAALEAGGSGSPQVAGVLLAAGRSSRFEDGNKLLAALDSESLVCHAARTLRDADLADTVAVIGHDGGTVRLELSGMSLRCVENTAFDQGLSTSVARGLTAVSDVQAVVFLPGDMPAVDPVTVDLLVRAYRAGLGTALAAAYDGRRGNPVLFDDTHFDDLRSLAGDTGGRSVLLDSEDSALIETEDPGTLRDIDTQADLDGFR